MFWRVSVLYAKNRVATQYQGDLSAILGSIDEYTKTWRTQVVSLLAKRIRRDQLYVN